jgi:hypothetical protein
MRRQPYSAGYKPARRIQPCPTNLPRHATKRTSSSTSLVALAATLCTGQSVYQQNLQIDHPAIGYYNAPLDNRVERLRRSGDVPHNLLGLLRQLSINPDSQALVFSKTSFQAPKIGPRNPRAIYFNDEVAVGWVRGSPSMELAAFDARQGVVFYTLTGSTLARSEACLRCHQGPATLGVPGIFVGSVFPGPSGDPHGADAIVTDHRTKFEDRWGGWYVTGTHGAARHRGNAIAPDPAEPETLETEGTQNLTSLARKFDTTGYLVPTSDLVALMTFEHQTMATNLITRADWESRMGREVDIEPLVRYLTFADEAPLPQPIGGVSTFTKTFPQRGPRDRQGRSLRDFDLQTRLFRYKLSYMIYSAAFDALPDALRARIYRRLFEVLSANDQRTTIEILQETKVGQAVSPAR